MPCDLSTRGIADVAIIVLWYRGASPAPFYRYVSHLASNEFPQLLVLILYKFSCVFCCIRTLYKVFLVKPVCMCLSLTSFMNLCYFLHQDCVCFTLHQHCICVFPYNNYWICVYHCTITILCGSPRITTASASICIFIDFLPFPASSLHLGLFLYHHYTWVFPCITTKYRFLPYLCYIKFFVCMTNVSASFPASVIDLHIFLYHHCICVYHLKPEVRLHFIFLPFLIDYLFS